MDEDYQLIVHPSTVESPPAGGEELVGRGMNRASDILGAVPPGGRVMPRRGSVGTCHVCGQIAQLTFEHMPPRAAGNSRPRRAVDLATSLTNPVEEFPSRGWVPMQRGMGMYATCMRCNSFSGTAYVPAYLQFISILAGGLQDWAERADRAGETRAPAELHLTIRPVQPGAVMRQVLFMLLAASGSAGLGNRYPLLREIVQNKTPVALPPEMAVRMTLLVAQRARLHPVVAEADFQAGRERVMVEVAFTPCAWLLEIGDPSARGAANVSAWTQVPADEEQEVNLTTTVGSVVTALPADYRHRSEIPDDELAEADQQAAHLP